MKKKILIGSILAVVLLVLVSIAPSINANVSKTNSDILLDENSTPIALVFQLIAKLRNHPNIKSVETEDDVLQIIENDAELNDIFVKLKSYDCGCEDDESDFEWRFPIICNVLLLFVVIGFFMNDLIYDFGYLFAHFMATIAYFLKCSWIFGI